MGKTRDELESNLDDSEKRVIDELKPSYQRLCVYLPLLKSVSTTNEFKNVIANYNKALEPMWGEVHLSCGGELGGRKRRRKSRRRKKKSKRRRKRRRTKKKRRKRK